MDEVDIDGLGIGRDGCPGDGLSSGAKIPYSVCGWGGNVDSLSNCEERSESESVTSHCDVCLFVWLVCFVRELKIDSS